MQTLARYRQAGGNRAIVVVPGDDNLSARLQTMAAAGYDDAVVSPDSYSQTSLSEIRSMV